MLVRRLALTVNVGHACRTSTKAVTRAPVWQGESATDIWSSADLRTWRLDTAVAPWRGRNNIFAAVHDGGIYVVASVQSQFYNTFFSYDGANYDVRENACALTKVDVLSVISFNGYLMAFTLGCHNQLDFNQVAVDCSHPYAGRMHALLFSACPSEHLVLINISYFMYTTHRVQSVVWLVHETRS